MKRDIEIYVNDPCNQSNRSMKLVFDILTPRPHFIIIHREEFQKSNITDNEIKDLIELINEFLLNKPEYDNNTILSFHRGKWYQKNDKKFHAHLCVPKKPYCREIKKMIDEDHRLSSDDYLNKLHNEFLLSKIQYLYYQNRCLSNAYLYFNDSISYKVPLQQFNTSKFTVVYHASAPRIGILANKSNLNLKSLYNFLNNFYLIARKKLSLINPLYENFGAHLCLYVSGKKKINSNLTERIDRILINDINQSIKLVRLVGYIQIDEQLYLQWLPKIFQSIWLKQFQNSQHIVYT